MKKRTIAALIASALLSVMLLPCSASYTVPEKAPFFVEKIDIWDFDSYDGWASYGGDCVWQLTENVEGGGQATATRCVNDLVSLVGGYETRRIDLSKYDSSKLYIHFWLYLSSVSDIHGDMVVEFNSGGTDTQTAHAIAINSASGVHDGWNEIFAPFTDFNAQFCDLSNIGQFRFYYNTVNPDSAFALNDMYFGVAGEKPETDNGDTGSAFIPVCTSAVFSAVSIVIFLRRKKEN